MIILEAPFATPLYDEMIQLRDEILRQPLGLSFQAEDLAEEYLQIHLGLYSPQMELLACLVLKPLEDGIIKMRQVAVSASHQKQGLGTQIVHASEEVARQKGFHQMTLHARESAIPFYTRLGYKKQGRKFKEVGIPHYRMGKEL